MIESCISIAIDCNQIPVYVFFIIGFVVGFFWIYRKTKTLKKKEARQLKKLKAGK